MPNIDANKASFESHTPPPSTGRSRWATLSASFCASLTLAACASLGSGTPEEQVSQRAAQRWQALAAGEFSRAYNYNTPSFRAVVTPDGYRNRFGGAVNWKGAEVVRVDCPEADKCTARLRVDFKPVLSSPKSPAVSTHMDETWILENGQWWFFQKI